MITIIEFLYDLLGDKKFWMAAEETISKQKDASIYA